MGLSKKITIYIVSVNFNHKEGLLKTIKSVAKMRAQYQDVNFFHAVIDGVSNDGSLDIIKEYQKNIDYFISEPDENHWDGMNKGIDICYNNLNEDHSNYVIFMNSGDQFFIDSKQLIDFKKFKNHSVIYGWTKTDDGGIGKQSQLNVLHHGGMPFNHQSAFYNLNLIEKEDITYKCKPYYYNDFRQIYRLYIKYDNFLEINNFVVIYELATSTGMSRWDLNLSLRLYLVVFQELGIIGLFRRLMLRLLPKWQKEFEITRLGHE